MTSWSVSPWAASTAGVDQQSPDLSAVIQEFIDDPSFDCGANALVLIITGSLRWQICRMGGPVSAVTPVGEEAVPPNHTDLRIGH